MNYRLGFVSLFHFIHSSRHELFQSFNDKKEKLVVQRLGFIIFNSNKNCIVIKSDVINVLGFYIILRVCMFVNIHNVFSFINYSQNVCCKKQTGILLYKL